MEPTMQNRRKFIKRMSALTAGSGLIGLAGCTSGGDGDGDDGGNGGTVGNGGDEPVSFKLGHGLAAEEPIWLMQAMPDILNNWGEEYEAEFVQFSGSTRRFQAFQAGEIDAGTVTAFSAVFLVERGIPLTIVASISQETADGYSTQFVTMPDTGFELSAEGMRGTSIGICDIRSSCHMWSLSAIEEVELTVDEDVDLVNTPFPTMPDAVSNGRVTAATMAHPFDVLAINQNGAVAPFDAVDVMGFDHDLLEVWFGTHFLNQNPDAVRAFLEDYQIAIEHYENNMEESKRALLDAGFVQTPEETYLDMSDWHHQITPLTDALERVNQRSAELGWIDEPVDLEALYNLDYLPE